jgi:hypothetical protein
LSFVVVVVVVVVVVSIQTYVMSDEERKKRQQELEALAAGICFSVTTFSLKTNSLSVLTKFVFRTKKTRRTRTS